MHYRCNSSLLETHTNRGVYVTVHARPAWLDLAHRKLDGAVFAAYGWPDDLSEEGILERLLKRERAGEQARA
jgi:hypothetical protein